MQQLHEQTVREVCRLARANTGAADAELIECFGCLTQLESLYVAAKSAQVLDSDCLALATSISGRGFRSLEDQALRLLRQMDIFGLDALVFKLFETELIAALTLIAIINDYRPGLARKIADRLVAISDQQIEEVI